MNTTAIRQRWRNWRGNWGLDALLLLALAAATVNRFAPEPVSGDVMLYSVMSLQNVTLFFWGQNRLLNVGPALTSLIHDPAANLWANLLFPTLVFFGLLRAWAGVAVRLVSPPDSDGDRQVNTRRARQLFLLLSAIVLLVLKPHAVYEVVVWHVEYPLACLLLLWAHETWFAASGANRLLGPLWLRMLVVALLLGLALGVNFSTVIPALALVGGRMLLQRRLEMRNLGFAGLAVVLFLLWWLVAHRVAGPSGTEYAGFSFATLREGLPLALGSMQNALWLPRLEALLLVVVTLRLWQAWRNRSSWNVQVLWVQILAVLFALGWLLLFAGNAWVQKFAFHYRYFVFAWLAFGIALSLELAKLLAAIPGFWRMTATALAFLWLIAVLIRAPVPLQQYAFAQRVAPIVGMGTTIYAGEFEQTWSAVMAGMLQRQPAFGVTGRAEGNKKGLREHIASALRQDGRLEVGCLQDTVESCLKQVNAYAEQTVRVREARLIAGRKPAWYLVLEQGMPPTPAMTREPAAHWTYRGTDLISLYSQVGYGDLKGIHSLGEEGFLLYGPYRAASQGVYRLQIFGTVQQAGTAWADVVARSGNLRYAQFALQPGEDALVDELVSLPRDEPDVEIRVYVGTGDVVRITGYEWRLQAH
ncbi:hypothetical protein [Sterolibacterium denitrificans]|uniref:hypothetical protein n=1 Tax=Sterolibacterium denitrificans TaxID=157592 RepID=UPI001E33586E|nr:hypothetical protein [Sterolibacterium denitrificans]